MHSLERRSFAPLIKRHNVLRRAKPGLIVFAVLFGAVALTAMLLPNKYQTHLKILVKNERINPLVGLDQRTTGLLYLDDISEARINTEIELLTSADLLREVVDRCHLADYVGTRSMPPAKRRELAVRKLGKDLHVQPVRKSNIIEVTYESTNPALAASVLHNLAGLYLEDHLRLHGAPGSYEFFQQLADKYSAELEKAEADLSAFRREQKIVALPEEKTLALDRVSEIEKQYLASSAAAQQNQQQVARLKDFLATLPANMVTERRALPNQYSVERLNTLLVELENQHAQIADRYRSSDRIVQELDGKITETRAALDAAKRANAQEVATGANPTYQTINSEYIQAAADLAGNRARSRELMGQLALNRARLDELDQATMPYDDLVRRVTQMEQLSQLYKGKANEARVGELLDKQRIANVAIAEQPVESNIPSSPRRKLILALGFFWSALIAGGVAFGFDRLSERITTPFSLEQAMAVPLLAAVPAGAASPSYGGAFSTVRISMHRPTDQSGWKVW